MLPYLILTILVLKGFTLPGCYDGLKHFFKPDWSKIADLKVWTIAIQQNFFSTGVSYGTLIYYGSKRRHKHTRLITPCYMLPLINSISSIYAAFTMYTYLGYFAQLKGIKIEQLGNLIESGPYLLYVIFP
jgi:solute carrier family 6 amino acid transporter-like protein 5/7/9/14